MFRPYIPVLKASSVTHEIVKFYIDNQENWNELVKQKFPDSPNMLERIKGVLDNWKENQTGE